MVNRGLAPWPRTPWPSDEQQTVNKNYETPSIHRRNRAGIPRFRINRDNGFRPNHHAATSLLRLRPNASDGLEQLRRLWRHRHRR